MGYIAITTECLVQLPVGQFVRFDRTQNMDEEWHDCVVWEYRDTNCPTVLRRSYFDIENGDYICEAVGERPLSR